MEEVPLAELNRWKSTEIEQEKDEKQPGAKVDCRRDNNRPNDQAEPHPMSSVPIQRSTVIIVSAFHG